MNNATNNNEIAADILEETAWQKTAFRITERDANWAHALRLNEVSDFVVVTATLTVNGVSREGIGIVKEKTIPMIRNAEREAFQSAAEKFIRTEELKTEVQESMANLQSATEKLVSPTEAPAGKSEPPVNQEISTSEVQVNEDNLTPEQAKMVADWRDEIKNGLTSIGVNPDNALNKYDTKQIGVIKKKLARDETVKFVLGEMRKKVAQGYGNSGWDLNDIERDMKKFGIEKGINTATDQQIEAVYKDMKAAKRI